MGRAGGGAEASRGPGLLPSKGEAGGQRGGGHHPPVRARRRGRPPFSSFRPSAGSSRACTRGAATGSSSSSSLSDASSNTFAFAPTLSSNRLEWSPPPKVQSTNTPSSLANHSIHSVPRRAHNSRTRRATLAAHCCAAAVALSVRPRVGGVKLQCRA